MPVSPELGRWRPGLCSYIVIPCLKKKKGRKEKKKTFNILLVLERQKPKNLGIRS
jgi:hypothetical protein